MESSRSLPDWNSKRLGIFVSTDTYGGAERYIGLLVDALRDERLEVIVAGNLERPTFPPSVARFIPIGPKWSRKTIVRSLLAMRREKRAYMKVALTEELDGAHLQFKREQILLSKLLSRSMTVIWTEHGTLPRGAYGAILRRLYKKSSRYAECILCVSQAVVDDLMRCGVPGAKLKLAENAVNLEVFRPCDDDRAASRDRLELASGEVAVLVISRLDPKKGIHRVIEALRHLPDNYVLLIAGTGPAESILRRQAASCGKRVRFLGFRDDSASLMRAADVFCFASTAISGEGVPTMSVLEAMATGLPVIATSDSGLLGWLSADTGVVADSGDKAIAQGIVEAFDRRKELGSNALKRAQDYNLVEWRAKQARYVTDALGGLLEIP